MSRRPVDAAVETCPPAEWAVRVEQALRAGCDFFEWLGCVDDIGRPGADGELLRVVVVLRSLSDPPTTLRLSTEVPRDRPQLASVSALFPGATWHEREAAEMFGVEFLGGDGRRLLLAPEYEGTPMRKDEPLAARAAVAWPGAKEPGESSDDPGGRVGAAGPAGSDGPSDSAGAAGSARPGGRGGQAPSRRRTSPPGVPDPAVWGDRDPAAAPADAAEVAGSAVGGRVRRRRS